MFRTRMCTFEQTYKQTSDFLQNKSRNDTTIFGADIIGWYLL